MKHEWVTWNLSSTLHFRDVLLTLTNTIPSMLMILLTMEPLNQCVFTKHNVTSSMYHPLTCRTSTRQILKIRHGFHGLFVYNCHWAHDNFEWENKYPSRKVLIEWHPTRQLSMCMIKKHLKQRLILKTATYTYFLASNLSVSVAAVNIFKPCHSKQRVM